MWGAIISAVAPVLINKLVGGSSKPQKSAGNANNAQLMGIINKLLDKLFASDNQQANTRNINSVKSIANSCSCQARSSL